jgi:hypothetical protein
MGGHSRNDVELESLRVESERLMHELNFDSLRESEFSQSADTRSVHSHPSMFKMAPDSLAPSAVRVYPNASPKSPTLGVLYGYEQYSAAETHDSVSFAIESNADALRQAEARLLRLNQKWDKGRRLSPVSRVHTAPIGTTQLTYTNPSHFLLSEAQYFKFLS